MGTIRSSRPSRLCTPAGEVTRGSANGEWERQTVVAKEVMKAEGVEYFRKKVGKPTFNAGITITRTRTTA